MGSVGRRLALLPLLVTAALAWPAVSTAATGQIDDNGVMVYTADAGESNAVTFSFGTDQFDNPAFLVVDAPAVQITPIPPCQPGAAQNEMSCPQDGGGIQPPVTSFSANLGDGDDTVTLLANLPTSIGAGGGADTMKGGPANDFLRGGQGKDSIDGGVGDDQLIGDDVINPADPTSAFGDDDTLNGGPGNDSMDGQAGSDTVRGGDGNDTLSGSGGNDVFPAEAGSDGADVLNGGDGVDTATYSARTDPLQLSLDDQANDGLQGSASDNVHTDVENLVGGSAGDIISGSGQPNTLDGGGGDDRLAGDAGDDALTGATGNDNESGGDGNDTVDGGDGGDTLSGDSGDDSMAGGGDDDSLDGGAGADVFAGGDGADTATYATRTAGVTVSLDGNAGDGEPGEGDNVQADVENVLGGAGADTFLGSAAGNTLDGGAGEDYSDGGPGADSLVGGDAGDVMRTRGSGEPDTVTCGPGPDFVVAKANDTIAPDCDRADRGVNQRPKRRDSAVVAPTTGTLQMSPAGIVRRVPLQDKVVLPLASIVDAVAGTVKVTSAPTTRKLESVTLERGAFDITQTRAKLALTQFALQGGDFSGCPTAAGRRASAAAGKKSSTRTVRQLWASGKGSFRTKGRYAAATVRGTSWQTIDRCDGTLTKVKKGAVSVTDLIKKKTVVVKAGASYLAKR
jgi:Ca2+-binding RTX toxin-like protein